MPRPELFWAATIGSLAALDYWAAKNAIQGDTLSEVTRAAFRVHTPIGSATFTAGLLIGGVILRNHICRPIVDHLAS